MKTNMNLIKSQENPYVNTNVNISSNLFQVTQFILHNVSLEVVHHQYSLTTMDFIIQFEGFTFILKLLQNPNIS